MKIQRYKDSALFL